MTDHAPRTTFTLRTDSYDCPDCGRVVVATDDLVVELSQSHDCPDAGRR